MEVRVAIQYEDNHSNIRGNCNRFSPCYPTLLPRATARSWRLCLSFHGDDKVPRFLSELPISWLGLFNVTPPTSESTIHTSGGLFC